ncbi:hypothetical protein Tco_1501067, partial [Tanacetum coccineum]
DFEQTPVVDFTNNEITSDSNIIPYSQYLKETQQAAVQDTNLYAQQDSMILSEKESLLQTFTVFKNESKEKENKYMENEIDLEKKVKELDNIVYKVGQSARTVHMLTKLQVFYDNTHKQALGYQNLFYLKKAQRIKPTLYDGSVISSQHVAILVIDDEETLILEEVSRSKMLAKQNDPISKEKKVNTTPINYVELNKLSEDFVKKRITSDAITEGEWGFEHTKAVFLKEIIPFLTTLKDIFNVFDRDLLNEVTEVQTVFNQMEAAVQQCSLDKQCFEIVKKELFLENDRLLQKIISQDVLLSVMNSTTINGEYVNLEMQRSESCDECFDLDAELLKTQKSYNDLLKSYSQLEKHCISLELSIQLNQEIFQKDKSCDNQNALEIPEYFKYNDWKAQLQAKYTIICKLKEHIKSMRENDKEEKVKQDMDEIETINIELEHSVAKLLFENERLHKEIDHLKRFTYSLKHYESPTGLTKLII